MLHLINVFSRGFPQFRLSTEKQTNKQQQHFLNLFDIDLYKVECLQTYMLANVY